MRTVLTALRRGEAFANQAYTGPAASSQMLRPYRTWLAFFDKAQSGLAHITPRAVQANFFRQGCKVNCMGGEGIRGVQQKKRFISIQADQRAVQPILPCIFGFPQRTCFYKLLVSWRANNFPFSSPLLGMFVSQNAESFQRLIHSLP